jgi:serine/threonine protein kinase
MAELLERRKFLKEA